MDKFDLLVMGVFSIQDFQFLFSLGFHSDGVPDDGIDVDGRDGPQRGSRPVNDSVLDVGVALAPELQTGGENRVEVTAGSRERYIGRKKD